MGDSGEERESERGIVGEKGRESGDCGEERERERAGFATN